MYPIQTTKPQSAISHIFHQKAETFDLTVTLTDHKLVVVLKDYIDRVIYEKEYTQSDIGEDIHKKMDLSDVYQVFASTRDQNGQAERMKYELGSVIKNKGVSCYKIERGGRITVYQSIIDNNKNKQLSYQSCLQLAKTKSLTEAEAGIIRMTIQIEGISKELKKTAEEKEELRRRMGILEQESGAAKRENRQQQYSRRISSLEEGHKKQSKLLRIQIVCLIFFLVMILANFHRDAGVRDEMKYEINQLRQQTQEKLNNLAQKLVDLMKNIKEELLRQIKNVKQRLTQKFDSLAQQTSLRFQQNEKVLKPIKTTKNIHDLPQKYKNSFKIQGSVVQYKDNHIWTHYIFNYPIRPNQSFKFRVRIVQTQNQHVMVGVVDYAKQKDLRYSYDSKNGVCYYGANGRKYPSQSIQGNGFGQGDIVEVSINRATRTINYSVNGILKATDKHEILGDSSRVLMPYFETCNTFDTVEWLMD